MSTKRSDLSHMQEKLYKRWERCVDHVISEVSGPPISNVIYGSEYVMGGDSVKTPGSDQWWRPGEVPRSAGEDDGGQGRRGEARRDRVQLQWSGSEVINICALGSWEDSASVTTSRHTNRAPAPAPAPTVLFRTIKRDGGRGFLVIGM
ncbi:uncharacterized protein MYCFIDRAFT_172026 [Pseudocercospora fijiensis CIRAD86]|uniref:Uncharacterized protein n=1 Tax=Pseudocercospora fijiensis (strain CIRAD86) TaxID=383855 RepID=M3A558_PSEFD|nr:uncharacterized protein MYCFIDRAFT_172026 [Pseudocercospora fijiensis CIRAD86]EME86249.1 hypothetical protein MYCFIDRAFT_172026 [Pseudocercospora fijiensis CIRAD86]